MKRVFKYWYIILIVLVVGAGIWWFRREKPTNLKEYTVMRRSIEKVLSVSGSLSADKQADLKFQTSGRLAWVGVKEGDWIKKWQTIASLDKRLLQKNLQKELNDYMNERWNFEDDRGTYHVTVDDLNEYTLTPAARRVLEKAQFDLNNTVLDVEIQSVTNEYATIAAPFDGLIIKLNQPNPGINTYITDTIAQIVDPSTIYFRAEADELDVGKIKFDQAVKLKLDAYPEEIIETRVSDVGFTPITLSGGGTGYEVKIGIPGVNSDLKYKLGMNGSAEIVLEERESALVLPTEAIIRDSEGKASVLVKETGKLIERRVSVGLETDDLIEIIAGLREGDKVAIRENNK